MKQSVLKELEQIPGVGRKIAKDLWGLGLRSVQDLKDKDSEELYLSFALKKIRRLTDACFMCFDALYTMPPTRNITRNC